MTVTRRHDHTGGSYRRPTSLQCGFEGTKDEKEKKKEVSAMVVGSIRI